MEATCRRCAQRVPPHDVEADLGFARCAPCGVVFELPGPDGRARPRGPVPLPAGATLARTEPPAAGAGAGPYRGGGGPGTLVLSLPFNRLLAGVGLATAAAVAAVLAHLAATSEVPLATWLVLGALLVGAVYVGLVFLIDRTVVTASPEAIAVRSAPLPWPGATRIPAGRIRQLFVRAWQVQRREGVAGATYYTLCALDDRARRHDLATFERPDQALWLEHELERHLRIADAPVEGAHRG